MRATPGLRFEHIVRIDKSERLPPHSHYFRVYAYYFDEVKNDPSLLHIGECFLGTSTVVMIVSFPARLPSNTSTCLLLVVALFQRPSSVQPNAFSYQLYDTIQAKLSAFIMVFS
jgi:hypothetical protein